MRIERQGAAPQASGRRDVDTLDAVTDDRSNPEPGTPRIGRLTVVTVTYSPGAHLERFLATLPHATELPVTVVMADNGSTDGAPEAAVANHPEVHLLRTGGELRYVRAVNKARGTPGSPPVPPLRRRPGKSAARFHPAVAVSALPGELGS